MRLLSQTRLTLLPAVIGAFLAAPLLRAAPIEEQHAQEAIPERVAEELLASAEDAELTAAISEGEQIHAGEREMTRDAVQTIGDYFSSNFDLFGLGVLSFVISLLAVRIHSRRLFQRAAKLREEIKPAADMRLVAVDEVLTGSTEEQSELEAERLRREEQAERAGSQAATLEQRAEQFNAVTFYILTGALLLYLAWVVIVTSALPVFSTLLSPAVARHLLEIVIKIFTIVVGVVVLRHVTRVVAARLMATVTRREGETTGEQSQRAETLNGVANGAATIVLVVIAAIMILQQLGLPVGPILTGAGIAGIAIGFGAQSLVRDFIAGFFILFENHFRIGDVVTITGHHGIVERITMRATYLRDKHSSTLYVIPNGEIKTVENYTFNYARAVADVGVSYGSDPDQVMKILLDVGRDMRCEEPWDTIILDDPEVLGLNEFADSALIFKVLIKSRPLQQWTVMREYNRRVKYAFDKAGVEIPFPHRTVYHRLESDQRPVDLNLSDRRPVNSA
jgi:small conductance mechanosensitive channel